MVNEVQLIGYLGKDPEIKQTGTGKQVANLDVSTWESFFNENKEDDNGKKGRWDTITDWHKVVVWGDAVKRVENMKKGDPIRVTGKLKTRSWEDQNGNKHYVTEVVGFASKLPQPKAEGQRPAEQKPVPQQKPEEYKGSLFGDAPKPEDDYSDLPF